MNHWKHGRSQGRHAQALASQPESGLERRSVSNTFPRVRPDEWANRARAVNLPALCASVFSRLAHFARAREVELETAHFAWEAWTDEDVLRSVLTELVAREIHRAKRSSTISVVTTPRKGSTEVRIINWGPMSEANPEDWIADAGATPEDWIAGMPLGFRHGAFLLEAHGGSVRSERCTEGSIVCIRLPRSR